MRGGEGERGRGEDRVVSRTGYPRSIISYLLLWNDMLIVEHVAITVHYRAPRQIAVDPISSDPYHLAIHGNVLRGSSVCSAL